MRDKKVKPDGIQMNIRQAFIRSNYDV